MTTDIEWEKWGVRDPYFSVLTNPKFRASALTDEAREEFFALGRYHVDHVLSLCGAHVDPSFAPQRVRSNLTLWLERADKQLYRAKSGGRNRAEFEAAVVSHVSAEERSLLFAPSRFDEGLDSLSHPTP